MMSSPRIFTVPACLMAMMLVTAGVIGAAAAESTDEPLSVPADTLPAKEFNALMTFVAANPECQSFADGCQICRRLTAHQIACSTPGIACHKGEWACQTQSPPPK